MLLVQHTYSDKILRDSLKIFKLGCINLFFISKLKTLSESNSMSNKNKKKKNGNHNNEKTMRSLLKINCEVAVQIVTY